MNYVIWLNSGRTDEAGIIIMLEALRVLYCSYFLLSVAPICNEPAIFQSRTTLWSHTRYVKLKSNRCLCWSSDVLRVKIVAARYDGTGIYSFRHGEKACRNIARNWIFKLERDLKYQIVIEHPVIIPKWLVPASLDVSNIETEIKFKMLFLYLTIF